MTTIFGKKINWPYVVEKFIRDTVMFFIATEAFVQFTEGAGSFDPGALGMALLGAAGTAVYRLLRELGLFGTPA